MDRIIYPQTNIASAKRERIFFSFSNLKKGHFSRFILIPMNRIISPQILRARSAIGNFFHIMTWKQGIYRVGYIYIFLIFMNRIVYRPNESSNLYWPESRAFKLLLKKNKILTNRIIIYLSKQLCECEARADILW